MRFKVMLCSNAYSEVICLAFEILAKGNSDCEQSEFMAVSFIKLNPVF